MVHVYAGVGGGTPIGIGWQPMEMAVAEEMRLVEGSGVGTASAAGAEDGAGAVLQ